MSPPPTLSRSPNVLVAGDDEGGAWRSYLTHLECTGCARPHGADHLQQVCQGCGEPLAARYDLAELRRCLDPGDFKARRWDIWRYRELLPVAERESAVSLGEGLTPCLRLGRRAATSLGMQDGRVGVKDESTNPTASFKARGMAVALSRAFELGMQHVALSTTGNAGVAAAAYGAALGLDVHIAMPADTPLEKRRAPAVYGAQVLVREGPLDTVEQWMNSLAAERGWFVLSTFQEPYRVEGKKTFGFELAEQGGWGSDCLPDVLVYPTGGGTGFVALWKAFAELRELGWIGPQLPRMVAVQAAGCAPIVRAFERGGARAERWERPRTSAAGIRVTATRGDALVLDVVRASGGTAVAVDEDEIEAARHAIPRLTGIHASAEGAAAWAAIPRLRDGGFLSATERVVVFNTASGAQRQVVESETMGTTGTPERKITA